MKVAIYTDNERAEKIVNICQIASATVQNIYNELKKTGCSFTVREILDLWQSQGNEEAIKKMIFDKKIQDEPPVIFGMKLSRQSLYHMVEIDNIQEIKETYTGKPFIFEDNLHAGYALRYMSIENDTVKLLDTLENTVKSEFCTIYADNEIQKAKADKLLNVAAALNEKELDNILKFKWRESVEIEGLKLIDGMFVPDMKAIWHLISR